MVFRHRYALQKIFLKSDIKIYTPITAPSNQHNNSNGVSSLRHFIWLVLRLPCTKPFVMPVTWSSNCGVCSCAPQVVNKLDRCWVYSYVMRKTTCLQVKLNRQEKTGCCELSPCRQQQCLTKSKIANAPHATLQFHEDWSVCRPYAVSEINFNWVSGQSVLLCCFEVFFVLINRWGALSKT